VLWAARSGPSASATILPMCNRYIAPDQAAIEAYWHLGGRQPWQGGGVYPRSPGPFVRAAAQSGAPELVVGQWGLIPWFAKAAKLSYATNNARAEELAGKASYKQPWARGQRCIIPALSFDEPCWETSQNVWWTFRRADGAPWGLAGLWNTWTDPATGELVESYTMLTLNADAHPLMRRMHKPDPRLGPDQQDKRSVVAIEQNDLEQWLHGSVADAQALVRLPAPEGMVALAAA
jgi:putative SOS response-associated peptidase YedK